MKLRKFDKKCVNMLENVRTFIKTCILVAFVSANCKGCEAFGVLYKDLASQVQVQASTAEEEPQITQVA